MRFSVQILVAALAALLCAVSSTEAKLQRGLAWGVNDNYGPRIAKGLVKWYWHWQDGPNPKFNGKLEWVPCFWGPKYYSQWNQRKQEMKGNLPKYLLSFNEPEIPGQSNLDPKYAAKLHMKELEPYAKKGVKISSPQMVYKTEWLQEFMDECNKLGCTIDFIAIHWYGTTKDMAKFKKWIKTIHSRFNKPIWVTEYGITAASGSNMGAIKKFHMDATAWMTGPDAGKTFVNCGNNCVCIIEETAEGAVKLQQLAGEGGFEGASCECGEGWSCTISKIEGPQDTKSFAKCAGDCSCITVA